MSRRADPDDEAAGGRGSRQVSDHRPSKSALLAASIAIEEFERLARATMGRTRAADRWLAQFAGIVELEAIEHIARRLERRFGEAARGE